MGKSKKKTPAADSVAYIQALSPTVIPWLSTSVVSSWNAAQIQALTRDQLRAMTTSQITCLRTAQINAMAYWQVGALTDEQFASLTSSQIAALTRDQVCYLCGVYRLHTLSASQVQAMTASQMSWFPTSSNRFFYPPPYDGSSWFYFSPMLSTLPQKFISNITASQIPGWTSAELVDLVAGQIGWFSTSAVKAMSAAQLSCLSDLNALTADAVGNLGAAQLVGLNVDKMPSLRGQFLNRLGAMATSLAAVNRAGVQTFNLTLSGQDMITAFSTGQISRLQASALADLDQQHTLGLTAGQIRALSNAQIANMRFITRVGAQAAQIQDARYTGASTPVYYNGTLLSKVLADRLLQYGFDASRTSALSAGQVASISNQAWAQATADFLNNLTGTAFAAIDASKWGQMSEAAISGLSSYSVGLLTAAQLSGIRLDLLGSRIVDLSANAVASLTPTQIARMTIEQALLLPPEFVKKLDINTVRALSPNQVAVMSLLSLAVLPAQVLSVSVINTLGTAQFAALQVGLIPASVVNQIYSVKQAQWLRERVRQNVPLTADLMNALLPSIVAQLDTQQLAALPATEFARLSVPVLAAFTSSQWAAITGEQISSISVATLTALDTDVNGVCGLSSMLRYVSQNTFESLTLVQMTFLGTRIDHDLTLFFDDVRATWTRQSLINLYSLGLIDIEVAANGLTPQQFFGTITSPVAFNWQWVDADFLNRLSPSDFQLILPNSNVQANWGISGLSLAALRGLSEQAVSYLTDAQFAALSTTQLSAMGHFSALSASAVRSMGAAQIAALDLSQMNLRFAGLLSATQWSWVRPTQIGQIQASVWRDPASVSIILPRLSDAKLRAITISADMGTTLFGALSPQQWAALSPEQWARLSAAQLQAGGPQIDWSLISMSQINALTLDSFLQCFVGQAGLAPASAMLLPYVLAQATRLEQSQFGAALTFLGQLKPEFIQALGLRISTWPGRDAIPWLTAVLGRNIAPPWEDATGEILSQMLMSHQGLDAMVSWLAAAARMTPNSVGADPDATMALLGQVRSENLTKAYGQLMVVALEANTKVVPIMTEPQSASPAAVDESAPAADGAQSPGGVALATADPTIRQLKLDESSLGIWLTQSVKAALSDASTITQMVDAPALTRFADALDEYLETHLGLLDETPVDALTDSPANPIQAARTTAVTAVQQALNAVVNEIMQTAGINADSDQANALRDIVRDVSATIDWQGATWAQSLLEQDPLAGPTWKEQIALVEQQLKARVKAWALGGQTGTAQLPELADGNALANVQAAQAIGASARAVKTAERYVQAIDFWIPMLPQSAAPDSTTGFLYWVNRFATTAQIDFQTAVDNLVGNVPDEPSLPPSLQYATIVNMAFRTYLSSIHASTGADQAIENLEYSDPSSDGSGAATPLPTSPTPDEASVLSRLGPIQKTDYTKTVKAYRELIRAGDFQHAAGGSELRTATFASGLLDRLGVLLLKLTNPHTPLNAKEEHELLSIGEYFSSNQDLDKIAKGLSPSAQRQWSHLQHGLSLEEGAIPPNSGFAYLTLHAVQEEAYWFNRKLGGTYSLADYRSNQTMGAETYIDSIINTSQDAERVSSARALRDLLTNAPSDSNIRIVTVLDQFFDIEAVFAYEVTGSGEQSQVVIKSSSAMNTHDEANYAVAVQFVKKENSNAAIRMEANQNNWDILNSIGFTESLNPFAQLGSYLASDHSDEFASNYQHDQLWSQVRMRDANALNVALERLGFFINKSRNGQALNLDEQIEMRSIADWLSQHPPTLSNKDSLSTTSRYVWNVLQYADNSRRLDVPADGVGYLRSKELASIAEASGKYKSKAVAVARFANNDGYDDSVNTINEQLDGLIASGQADLAQNAADLKQRIQQDASLPKQYVIMVSDQYDAPVAFFYLDGNNIDGENAVIRGQTNSGIYASAAATASIVNSNYFVQISTGNPVDWRIYAEAGFSGSRDVSSIDQIIGLLNQRNDGVYSDESFSQCLTLLSSAQDHVAYSQIGSNRISYRSNKALRELNSLVKSSLKTTLNEKQLNRLYGLLKSCASIRPVDDSEFTPVSKTILAGVHSWIASFLPEPSNGRGSLWSPFLAKMQAILHGYSSEVWRPTQLTADLTAAIQQFAESQRGIPGTLAAYLNTRKLLSSTDANTRLVLVKDRLGQIQGVFGATMAGQLISLNGDGLIANGLADRSGVYAAVANGLTESNPSSDISVRFAQANWSDLSAVGFSSNLSDLTAVFDRLTNPGNLMAGELQSLNRQITQVQQVLINEYTSFLSSAIGIDTSNFDFNSKYGFSICAGLTAGVLNLSGSNFVTQNQLNKLFIPASNSNVMYHDDWDINAVQNYLLYKSMAETNIVSADGHVVNLAAQYLSDLAEQHSSPTDDGGLSIANTISVALNGLMQINPSDITRNAELFAATISANGIRTNIPFDSFELMGVNKSRLSDILSTHNLFSRLMQSDNGSNFEGEVFVAYDDNQVRSTMALAAKHDSSNFPIYIYSIERNNGTYSKVLRYSSTGAEAPTDLSNYRLTIDGHGTDNSSNLVDANGSNVYTPEQVAASLVDTGLIQAGTDPDFNLLGRIRLIMCFGGHDPANTTDINSSAMAETLLKVLAQNHVDVTNGISYMRGPRWTLDSARSIAETSNKEVDWARSLKFSISLERDIDGSLKFDDQGNPVLGRPTRIVFPPDTNDAIQLALAELEIINYLTPAERVHSSEVSRVVYFENGTQIDHPSTHNVIQENDPRALSLEQLEAFQDKYGYVPAEGRYRILERQQDGQTIYYISSEEMSGQEDTDLNTRWAAMCSTLEATGLVGQNTGRPIGNSRSVDSVAHQVVRGEAAALGLTEGRVNPVVRKAQVATETTRLTKLDVANGVLGAVTMVMTVMGIASSSYALAQLSKQPQSTQRDTAIANLSIQLGSMSFGMVSGTLELGGLITTALKTTGRAVNLIGKVAKVLGPVGAVVGIGTAMVQMGFAINSTVSATTKQERVYAGLQILDAGIQLIFATAALVVNVIPVIGTALSFAINALSLLVPSTAAIYLATQLASQRNTLTGQGLLSDAQVVQVLYEIAALDATPLVNLGHDIYTYDKATWLFAQMSYRWYGTAANERLAYLINQVDSTADSPQSIRDLVGVLGRRDAGLYDDVAMYLADTQDLTYEIESYTNGTHKVQQMGRVKWSRSDVANTSYERVGQVVVSTLDTPTVITQVVDLSGTDATQSHMVVAQSINNNLDNITFNGGSTLGKWYFNLDGASGNVTVNAGLGTNVFELSRQQLLANDGTARIRVNTATGALAQNNRVLIDGKRADTLTTVDLDQLGANIQVFGAFDGRDRVKGTQNGQVYMARSDGNTITLSGDSDLVTVGAGAQVQLTGQSAMVMLNMDMARESAVHGYSSDLGSVSTVDFSTHRPSIVANYGGKTGPDNQYVGATLNLSSTDEGIDSLTGNTDIVVAATLLADGTTVNDFNITFTPDGAGQVVKAQARGFNLLQGVDKGHNQIVIRDQSKVVQSKRLAWLEAGDAESVCVYVEDTSGSLSVSLGTGSSTVYVEDFAVLGLMSNDSVQAELANIYLGTGSTLNGVLQGHEHVHAHDVDSDVNIELSKGVHRIELGGQSAGFKVDADMVSQTSIRSTLLSPSDTESIVLDFGQLDVANLYVSQQSSAGNEVGMVRILAKDSTTTTNEDGTTSVTWGAADMDLLADPYQVYLKTTDLVDDTVTHSYNLASLLQAMSGTLSSDNKADMLALQGTAIVRSNQTLYQLASVISHQP